MSGDAVPVYEANAEALAARYDAVATEDLLSGLIDLLPEAPAPVLDVGAGSGRDAVWLVARGHPVTAAEPTRAFREVIAERLPQATVVDARLPDLAGVVGSFGLILANAVWHHLRPEARDAAFSRLAGLLALGGRLVVSLRHGTVPEGQPVFALDAEEGTRRALGAGFGLCRRHAAASHQAENVAAGISWTWLVLEREGAR